MLKIIEIKGNGNKQYHVLVVEYGDSESTERPIFRIFAKNQKEAINIVNLLLYRRHLKYQLYDDFFNLPECAITTLVMRPIGSNATIKFFLYVGRLDFPIPLERATTLLDMSEASVGMSKEKAIQKLTKLMSCPTDIKLEYSDLLEMPVLPDYRPFFEKLKLKSGQENIDNFKKNKQRALLGL